MRPWLGAERKGRAILSASPCLLALSILICLVGQPWSPEVVVRLKG